MVCTQVCTAGTAGAAEPKYWYKRRAGPSFHDSFHRSGSTTQIGQARPCRDRERPPSKLSEAVGRDEQR